jgi:hypothetical protein
MVTVGVDCGREDDGKGSGGGSRWGYCEGEMVEDDGRRSCG